MPYFIVLDYDQYKVHLFDEMTFKWFVDYDPDDEDEQDKEELGECVSPEVRIERLVESFGFDIAWCRNDAMTMIAEDMEGGCLDESGNEFLIGAANMLIQLVDNPWWDYRLSGEDTYW